MSKSALVGFSKGLARDLGEKNITVNLIQPGPIDTDMNPADSESGALQKTHSSLKKVWRSCGYRSIGPLFV